MKLIQRQKEGEQCHGFICWRYWPIFKYNQGLHANDGWTFKITIRIKKLWRWKSLLKIK